MLDFVSLAVDTVTVAFRTGLVVTEAANRVSAVHESDQNWSIILQDTATVDFVRKFCKQSISYLIHALVRIASADLLSTLPSTSKPYVSAYAPNWCTVSGPSLLLQLLIESSNFQNARYKNIPIFGPYHAPHIHCEYDVTNIVKDVSTERGDMCEQIPVLLDSKPEERHNFAILLEAAVREILLKPI
jgi:hypothetical protein